jgi:hypothetical protein
LYAIYKLSTDIVLSPVEKILLARAHKVGAWLDEGVTSLVRDDPGSKFEDLVTLGWETAARILWIRDTSTFSLNASNTLHFRRDDIKCAYCLSSSSLIKGDHDCPKCRHAVLSDAELTFFGPGSPFTGTTGRLVAPKEIRCHRTPECGGNPFNSLNTSCNSCSNYYHSQVRITPRKEAQEMIQEIFGEEIEEYELAMTV